MSPEEIDQIAKELFPQRDTYQRELKTIAKHLFNGATKEDLFRMRQVNVLRGLYNANIGNKGHKWIVDGTTTDEGYKIVTEDAYIGGEDDGYQREWIATVYDINNANEIVKNHNVQI
jgi:hypothetical protein